MKVEILRTPGTDLAHDLAGRVDAIELPKDLAEGQTVDLDDKAAEALIALGIARPVDKHDKADKHAPAKHDAPPAAKGHTHNPPAK